MKNLVKKIKEEYSKLSSLDVSVEGDCIKLTGLRVGMPPSEAQLKYLISFDNVDYYSKSDLRKGNKWFISACINIAKNYPDTNFKIETVK